MMRRIIIAKDKEMTPTFWSALLLSVTTDSLFIHAFVDVTTDDVTLHAHHFERLGCNFQFVLRLFERVSRK